MNISRELGVVKLHHKIVFEDFVMPVGAEDEINLLLSRHFTFLILLMYTL